MTSAHWVSFMIMFLCGGSIQARIHLYNNPKLDLGLNDLNYDDFLRESKFQNEELRNILMRWPYFRTIIPDQEEVVNDYSTVKYYPANDNDFKNKYVEELPESLPAPMALQKMGNRDRKNTIKSQDEKKNSNCK